MKTTKQNLSERAKNGKNGVQLEYVVECITNSNRATDEGKTFAHTREQNHINKPTKN